MGLLERLRGGLARTREVLETPIEDLARGRRPLDAAALESIEEALDRRGPRAAGGGRGARGAAREERRDRDGAASPRCARRCAPSCSARSSGRRGRRPSRSGRGSCSWWASTARARPPRSASWPPPGRGEGRSLLLCAADTFRAAAAEQLEIWAGRTGAAFHRGAGGRRPRRRADRRAAHGARARVRTRVLVDTAGRLHTKTNLMAELAKMAPRGGARGRRARRTRRCWCSTPRSAATASPRGASSRRRAG